MHICLINVSSFMNSFITVCFNSFSYQRDFFFFNKELLDRSYMILIIIALIINIITYKAGVYPILLYSNGILHSIWFKYVYIIFFKKKYIYITCNNSSKLSFVYLILFYSNSILHSKWFKYVYITCNNRYNLSFVIIFFMFFFLQ